MVALFGCAWAVIATAVCVGAVATRRSVLAWMKARKARLSGGDDTVEIVRPGLRKVAVYVALVVLALPAGVLAGGTALPGPAGGGGGLPLTGGTMTGTATFVPGSIVSINAGGQVITTANPLSTAVTDASLLANPAACGTNEVLAGVAVNNTAKATIDCEGDISANAATFASATVNGSFLANSGTILGATVSNPTQISGVLTVASAINNTFGIACTNGVTGSVCVQDDFSVNTGITIYGYNDTYEITPAALSGDVTDYTGCGGVTSCRIDSGGSARNIRSLGNTGRGRSMRLCAVNAAGALTLKHEDAAGTASMRFTFSGATDRVIAVGECRRLWYDTVSSRWREDM